MGSAQLSGYGFAPDAPLQLMLAGPCTLCAFGPSVQVERLCSQLQMWHSEALLPWLHL